VNPGITGWGVFREKPRFAHLAFTLFFRTTASIKLGQVMKLKTLLTGVLFASAFTTASALSVVSGNVPQIDSNLVFNPCSLAPGAGNPVFGCLNDNHTIVAALSSDEPIDFSGGQARVEAVDGAYSFLTIVLNPLSTVILNIQASEDGFVTFTDGAGNSGAFAIDGNGANFFTATGITGNFLTFHTSLTSGGADADIVTDTRQIRLGQGGVTPVPEPETYALMMAGLAAVGFISRRRRTRR
jgi:PEP-CTERM motif